MPKKFFSIYPRTKGAMLHGLKTDKGMFDFAGKTVINTSNASLVREIEEKYGGKRGSVDIVHDEQLSKAQDSGAWDIVKTKKGDALKTLHAYQFTVIKPPPPDFIERTRKFILKHGLNPYVWLWDIRNKKNKRVVGFRVFGFEYSREL